MNAIQMPIVQTLKDRTIVIVKLVFKEMEKTVQVWDVSMSSAGGLYCHSLA